MKKILTITSLPRSSTRVAGQVKNLPAIGWEPVTFIGASQAAHDLPARNIGTSCAGTIINKPGANKNRKPFTIAATTKLLREEEFDEARRPVLFTGETENDTADAPPRGNQRRYSLHPNGYGDRHE